MSRWYVFLPQIAYVTVDGPINPRERVLWLWICDVPAWLVDKS